MGYAVEAANSFLSLAWDVLRMEDVVAVTSILNRPSERVMQRIGMSQVGEFDHDRVSVESRLRRHVFYRIERPTHRCSIKAVNDSELSLLKCELTHRLHSDRLV